MCLSMDSAVFQIFFVSRIANHVLIRDGSSLLNVKKKGIYRLILLPLELYISDEVTVLCLPLSS